MYIPLSYWGAKVCPNYLQTGSLVLYYNTQIADSYPGNTPSGTFIYNLADTSSYVGTVALGIGAYNPTLLALAEKIDVTVPWNLYDGSASTILVRGIFLFPTGSSSNYFVLQNTQNSKEGLQYYPQSGNSFGFSRGVNDCVGVMPISTGMNRQANAFQTLAVVRENTPTGKLYLTSDKSNFGQQFTQSLAGCTIINETDYFNTSAYIQSVVVYNKQLTQTELISASQAMECGALPQGYGIPIPPNFEAVSWSFTENSQDGQFKIYDDATTLATLTANGTGSANVSASHYVTASLVPVNYPTSGSIRMNLNVNGGVTLSNASNANTTISSSFIVSVGTPYTITGSITWYTGSLVSPLAVSASLKSVIDINNTLSYDGTGSTIFDLSGNGVSPIIGNTTRWIYDSSSLATKTLKLNNTASFDNVISFPSINVSGSYSLFISMYGSNAFWTSPQNAIPLFQTNPTDLTTNQNGLYNGANNNIRSLITPGNGNVSIGNVVNNSWQVYQVSYNGITNVVNYAINDVTGSYSTFDFDFNNRSFQFNIFGGTGDYGYGVGGYGSGSMIQVAAIYTGSLSGDQMVQNWNSIKGRYGY